MSFMGEGSFCMISLRILTAQKNSEITTYDDSTGPFMGTNAGEFRPHYACTDHRIGMA